MTWQETLRDLLYKQIIIIKTHMASVKPPSQFRHRCRFNNPSTDTVIYISPYRCIIYVHTLKYYPSYQSRESPGQFRSGQVWSHATWDFPASIAVFSIYSDRHESGWNTLVVKSPFFFFFSPLAFIYLFNFLLEFLATSSSLISFYLNNPNAFPVHPIVLAAKIFALYHITKLGISRSCM